MPYILSVGTAVPPFTVSQETSRHLSRLFFQEAFADIDRLLDVFANSRVTKRHFCVPLSWFESDHTPAEKNRLYVEHACALGAEAIGACLQKVNLSPADIDCLLFVSSTGLATPSIDARLLNRLPFREEITRIPLWGLGCAGGAMGLARAAEYARAYPHALVLMLAVELCGLTFIRQDMSKSNLIATSLFGDGAAAVLIAGDAYAQTHGVTRTAPRVLGTRTVTWKDSLDVMGWEVTNDGLKVIFSRDIPTLVKQRMRGCVDTFLTQHRTELPQLSRFILHPGGAKVLTAYQDALGMAADQLKPSEEVLAEYGNMSSPTVLFVLERSLQHAWQPSERGLAAALGPGFSCELILLEQE
ncbi:type III polyketide synthase [Brevibacillus sp. SYP-B805]|uniref:type III polyketide synthase n=1 Tax=Brevibacillus sp. SYP-B805 TaxID=1578199 RepID=UPI0013EBA6BA|nr:3-oxoacyl-[acyl-carrier-protein] synthase III C-terminal domain-containing protein [Brevibacillus sp. SYP-B805]NGQ93859.1 type III polyketide synthase [Brevibacillus sp. SYP-B805]